ncbi:S8 family serine peptidase [Mycoplasma sp. Z386]
MKRKKLFKKILLSVSPIFTLTTFVSAKMETTDTIERDPKIYNDMFFNLFNHLGIKKEELSYAPVKIGIIDGGLVDSNLLKYNGQTLKEYRNSDTYSLFHNENRLNKDKVIYNEEELDDLEKTDKNKQKTFAELYKKNSHATEIASILGSDSGFFKNAIFYSTTFKGKKDGWNGKTYDNVEVLRKNLEFMRKNNVFYVNMSYGSKLDEYLSDFINLKNYFLFSPDKEKLETFYNLLQKIDSFETSYYIYDRESSLLDEYAYKYNMKFFISAGNGREEFSNFRSDFIKNKDFIFSTLNKIKDLKITENIKDIYNKILNKIENNHNFYQRDNSLVSSKNTFIIGAYDINTKKPEYYSENATDNNKNSPLGLGPDNMQIPVISILNEKNKKNLTGTSFSTPVLLGMSMLLEIKNKKPFYVPQLKAILTASFESKNSWEQYNDLEGFGYISWEKMKYFRDKAKKLNIYRYPVADGNTHHYYLYSNLKFSSPTTVVFSNYSYLHEKNEYYKLENFDKLSEEEIKKYVNPFTVSVDVEIVADSSAVYKIYHLSHYESTAAYLPENRLQNVSKVIIKPSSDLATEYKLNVFSNNDVNAKIIWLTGVWAILD